jgi:predicted nucleic acid-binding Zn ribbon protein
MIHAARDESTRRCEQCGRALAPDERSCEGCALARVTTGPRARRATRAPIVFGIVAATILMALLLWLLFGRR